VKCAASRGVYRGYQRMSRESNTSTNDSGFNNVRPSGPQAGGTVEKRPMRPSIPVRLAVGGRLWRYAPGLAVSRTPGSRVPLGCAVERLRPRSDIVPGLAGRGCIAAWSHIQALETPNRHPRALPEVAGFPRSRPQQQQGGYDMPTPLQFIRFLDRRFDLRRG